MRIATWNLARPTTNTGVRAERLRRHMTTVKADVWVLTETHRDFSPGDGYSPISLSQGVRAKSNNEYWTAIWVKGTGECVPLTADPHRTACARVPLAANRFLLVYGTVLPWLTDTHVEGARGAEAFCEILRRQQQEWHDLHKNFPADGFCVAGDFNQDLDTHHYYGSKVGRESLRAALKAENLTCYTCEPNDPVARKSAHKNIDHICLSPGLKPTATHVSEAWPEEHERGGQLSDHFGIYMDVEEVDG